MLTGSYNLGLVAISYGIAFFASYIALDFAGRLRIETNPQVKWYWLIGGAFSMGAGIWSMHFIGMLAFIMPMSMGYEPFWTIASLLAAILSAGFAMFLLRDEARSIWYLSAGGVILGLGIATMHYMGMAGMTGMNIRYLPGLFTVSIVIAIVASEAALWLALKSNKGSFTKQIRMKILSGLIMGAAICGMHYTGMAAAVFTPLHMHPTIEHIDPFTLSLYITGITGIILTIALIVSTYKQLMASATQNERDFLNSVLNNLSDGVLACDPVGKIIMVNPAFKKLFNLPQVDYVTEQWAEPFSLYRPNHDKPISYLDLPINRALRGAKFEKVELVLQLNNAEHKHNVLISGQPICNINDEKLGAVIVVRDITVGKRAKELESVNKELEDFAYITSHDLKAPLRAIESLTSWIEEDSYTSLNDESKEHFALLKKRVQRMNRLIEGILHYSRVGRKNIEASEISVQQLLDDIILGLSVPSGFDIKIASSMPTLIAPEILLRQVFSNLMSNAIKHHHLAKGKIIITSSKLDDYYQFCVEDDGPGIPKKYQDKIFVIYQTLQPDSEQESNGIGLAIVKKAVSRVNGKIWVKSEEGKGASFCFTWPARFKEAR